MTLRIAMISEHASPTALIGGADAGGQNVYVDEVARALAALGHRVDVFTRRESQDAPQVVDWADGVRIVNVPAGPAEVLAKDDLWPHMPRFRDGMIRVILSDGARYDVLHGNFWMSGWVACELRGRLRIPAVQLFHALGVTKRRHQRGADTSPAERIGVERSIIRMADQVVATCPCERDELIADYGASPWRITQIPLGVDTRIFRPVDPRLARARIGLPADEDLRVITYVGRILPRKDIRNVVRALARLRDRAEPTLGKVVLLVVGGAKRDPDPVTTPEIGELQRLGSELGVQDLVVFVGMRGKDELKDFYGAADVAVTTPWYEPFGLTPLEAMACGRPVIGSDVGGISYTVRHGETGLLVPPRDPDALASAFGELLCQEQRRRSMGEAARQRVISQFTWPLVAERTASLYVRAIAGSFVRAKPLVNASAAFDEIARGD